MPFLVEKLSGLKYSGHISPRFHVAVAFLPIPMFLISFLAVLTSISSCCRPASWEILPQEHGRIGLQAGKEGRGDAGTVTGTASFVVRGEKGDAI